MYTSKKGVIAAGDELTAQAGYEILKAGGNAFDGALAATLMSFVASSTITSMGGGGFMVSRSASGSISLLDFFTQTPIRKRNEQGIEFFPVIVDFGDKTQEFHAGLGTAATPGNLAGLWTIYQRHASLPFAEIAAPAIEAARKGYHLHPQTKYQADILAPILGLSLTGREIYFDRDNVKPLGGKISMPYFADFLEFIANEGPREFYEGEIAGKIVQDSQDIGGHLTMDDFLNYKAEDRKPLKISYRDHDIYTTTFPNAGGPLIAFTLSLLNQFPLYQYPWGSTKHLSLLKEAIEYTARIRKEVLEPNIYDQEIREKLLSDLLYVQFLEQVQTITGKPGNTTHVSIADEDNNFVGITTSVGEGCGYYIPGTQIMLNNMLGEEDLNPWGFHEWPLDKRISSMMSPTLVMKAGKPGIILGSGGSNRIRSAIVQAIVNHIDYKMGADDSVNAPRIHWERNHLDLEPGYEYDFVEKIPLPEEAQKIFWTARNMYFGGVHAVFQNEKNQLIPAGDRRRVGAIRLSD